jgi:hypothetical protein
VASPTVQTPEPVEESNSISRIFGVLFSPKATFQSIARRPTWLLPIVLLCIVESAIVGVYGHRVGWRSMLEKQLANNSQFQALSPAEQESRIEVALKYTPPIAYTEVILGPFLVAVILAGVFWLIFNMAVGAKIGFRLCLAVVAYALVPGIFLSLVGILILYLKDPSTVDLQNLIASNVGAFVSSDTAKWLHALLSSIDLFVFWEMILLAFGFSAAAPKKVSFGGAFAWIFVLWLVVVMIRVGFAAAFS